MRSIGLQAAHNQWSAGSLTAEPHRSTSVAVERTAGTATRVTGIKIPLAAIARACSGGVCACGVELAPLVGFGEDPVVQGAPIGLGKLGEIVILFPDWNGLQRERLALAWGAMAIR